MIQLTPTQRTTSCPNLGQSCNGSHFRPCIASQKIPQQNLPKSSSSLVKSWDIRQSSAPNALQEDLISEDNADIWSGREWFGFCVFKGVAYLGNDGMKRAVARARLARPLILSRPCHSCLLATLPYLHFLQPAFLRHCNSETHPCHYAYFSLVFW